MRSIKILGCGISGLTAAINLALKGYEVEIYEKRESWGSRFKGDFQGLENWTNSQDILEFLKEININPSFTYEPFNSCSFYNSELKEYKLNSKRNGFYLIRRGNLSDTIDTYLYNKARNLNVVFHFNSNYTNNDIDIVATGYNQPFLIALGINFKTNINKVALSIFDNYIAPSGYSYLLCSKGKGTIAIVTKVRSGNLKIYLNRAIEKFKKIKDFTINDPVQFSGCGTKFKYYKNSVPHIGESGFFQDALWGFGLRMAFHTGYLAAKSIIYDLNYWKLIKKEVIPLCRSTILNRFIYDSVIKKNYNILLKRISKSKDPVIFANKMYKPSFLKNCIYHFIKYSIQ